MSGFFTSLTWTDKVRSSFPLVAQCGACGLYKRCRNSKLPVRGDGDRKILLVSSGPSKNDDLNGKFSVHPLVKNILKENSVDVQKDCWTTNAIICRASEANGSDRNPTDVEVSHCRPNLIRTVEELKPEMIILLGGSAIKSVLGWLWKESVGNIERWDGWRIPAQRINAWICPTWDPVFVAKRSEENRNRSGNVAETLLKRHLKAAAELEGRPWVKVPNLAAKVRVEKDCSEAAKVVRAITAAGLPSAFDYETNTLKPDPSWAEIVTCSVSNGKDTVAYPWYGEAIKATREFLVSPIPKIASNKKFEERWTLKVFGHPVNNWGLCTMQSAHSLDNRQGISSIKFQGFVRLGQDLWDGDVKPFLISSAPNTPNRIKELVANVSGLNKLLLYNGLDSLVELKVAKQQAKELGRVLK